MRRNVHTAIIAVLLMAGAASPEGTKVKDYTVSFLRSERAAEWKDPKGGAFAEALRPIAGHELFLVTLKIEGAGEISLSNFKAHGADGQEHPCAFKSIKERQLDAEGNVLSAVQTVEKTLPFIVPSGVEVEHITIEGVAVPMASMNKSAKP